MNTGGKSGGGKLCLPQLFIKVLTVPLNRDGTFTFRRVMPGEPFRLVGVTISRQVTPVAPVATIYFTLNPGDGKFGFYAFGQAPFRISVKAHRFEDYLSDVIRLEPGELRFIKIELWSKGM
jgi:hypothetical protein